MATVSEFLNERYQEFDKVLGHLNEELKSLRTGRASTSLVEGVMVEAYQANQPLRDLAQISVPEPRQILIQPWDKSVSKDIEKAIQASPLGVNPVNEGGLIRVVLPPLTEERRKELTKIVGQYAENARISVRNVRESIIKELRRKQEEGDFSEDEKFRGEDQLQKKVEEVNEKIKTQASEKEREILTV